MKKYVFALTLLTGLVGTYPVSASQPSHDLGYCMNDNMTGEERKMLAKWIFFSMSEYPEIKPYANVIELDKENANKYAAELITRLLTKDCVNEAKIAIQHEGKLAIQGAFQLVGSAAVEELSTNSDVIRSMSGFGKYLDQTKFDSILSE
ncbi:hypothetical protein L4174_020510 [Photobacterium sp. CCB-ST2H9]|uniref:hypothetical protein n=1 Tax=Photobacterium sp. CCB-ST2H9 TaxID=2912855 RepID=UPI002002DD2C|nr:hypothetical protein [Photobacterium sp. CCB-ST2H9]UTM59098.1 hypothetical protein L4174_020510 [Photobacterium sp. CCB-ST2H9]